jgi:hypothetical protein
VTSGGARRGRRDNGLVAAAYAPAGDVDPRVGEHLLDVLAVRGIAAYLQPASDLHPVTRTTTLPARPTDRLFVDREHVDTARGYLAQLADESPAAGTAEPDFDQVFAGIVAGFDMRAESVTWPAAEDLDESPAEDEDDGAPPAERGLQRWRRSTVSPVVSAADPFPPEDDLDEDDEGYVPPPPPPLPRISLASVLAVLAVVAGFVIFFNPDLLPIPGAVAMTLGFLAILGGFVGLIWRLRSGDDDDDWDPDDGAVV